jgi:hypothetical protein
MSCNCKNKNKVQEKVKTQTIDGVIEIPNQQAPPYTWEEVIRVKDYLNSKIKTEEGRQNMYQFNEKYFGEVMMGYCDQSCLTRIRKRIEHATQKLTEYDNLKK